MRLLLSILLILLLLPDWSGASRLPLLDPLVPFKAVPVPLDARHPARQRLGALIFERGYRLESSDPAFGGFSSLFVAGNRFTLLNDGGNFVRFDLDAAGRIANRHYAALPGGPGSGWEKRDRDSESMTYDPGTRRFWVGFENFNQIWRYGKGLTRAEAHAAPPAMADWPLNFGAEAMVRLHDGRFIVIAEDDPWPHGIGRAAILFAGDPTRAPRRGYRFSYLPPRGFDPSDMAQLPDGRVVILNRRVTIAAGFTAAITIVDLTGIRPGALIAGREIARFDGSITRDNYEGIAVTQEPDGVKLWLVSDDNQAFFEQSLLMKFRLDDALIADPRFRRRLAPASSALRASGDAP